MATISLADIELASLVDLELYVASEAIVAGEVVFLDASDEAGKAVNTDNSKDAIAGVALQDAVENNYVAVIPNGATIQVSNTLVVGDVYVLAATAGDVMLASDLLSTHYLSVFGTVSATNKIVLDINNTGNQKV